MKFNNIDTSRKVFIVAEVGNNHEGNFELAKKLVLTAAECGVDAVKFQTFLPDHFVSASNLERLNRLRSFQLSYAQFEILSRLASDSGIEFFSTPLDIPSARFLNQIQPIFKISSGDNNFVQLLRTVMAFDKPVIVSTGLASLKDVEGIYGFFESQSKTHLLSLLHCVSSYPTPPQQANLLAIRTLASRFSSCCIGYSDHVAGVQSAIYSVAVGARIVEKHFTLDKMQSSFRDHELSADPPEMRVLVQEIRKLESMLGDGSKILQPCESAMKVDGRRSIAAARDLFIGELVSAEDLICLRPGSGFNPRLEEILLGRVVLRNVPRGQILTEDDLYGLLGGPQLGG